MIEQSEQFKGSQIVENRFIKNSNIHDDNKIYPLLKEYGGYSFNGGCFRIHTYESSIKWKQIIEEYYPKFIGKFDCFGFDWLGRQYTINNEKENEVLMFDISTREYFIADYSLGDFIYELSINPLEMVNEDGFIKLRSILEFTECFGHKTPLFLGGKDDEANLEITDMEVDWGINGQLWNAVKDLPDGTSIGKIKID